VGLLLLLGVAFYGGTRLSASSSGTSSSESPPQLVVAPSKKNVKKDDGTPRYGATQFLSFTINTLGGLEEHGECKHRPVDSSTRSCYLGNANITEDILHRLDIVEQVLHRIKEDAFAESPDIDHADDVLKIFMMPGTCTNFFFVVVVGSRVNLTPPFLLFNKIHTEFFWRGPYGAYSTELLLDQSSIGNQVIRRLRDMIADDFFGDFLFVFGTTITAQKSSPNKNTTERIPKSATDINYFNWAAVYKGGSNHKHYYAVTKKYISGADFLSRTTLPNPKEEQVDAYSAVDDALKEAFVTRGTELITNNVLEMDGLRIGVEICLDHRVGTLWNYLKTNREPLVDVLLVTSAGMAIERGPNPIVPGGVVYLSDGEASSAACMRTDDPADHYAFYPQAVCRSQPGGLKHIPIGGPG
jgi:hypothetical protein